MGWTNRKAYDTDLNRCMSRDRRYSAEQREKIIAALRAAASSDDERERNDVEMHLTQIQLTVAAVQSAQDEATKEILRRLPPTDIGRARRRA